MSTLVQQAAAHLDAGHLAQSEALSKEVLKRVPHHPDALHLLGVAARQAGNHVLAVDFITRAIKSAPQPSAFMYFNRGLAWQAQGQRQQAIADYRQAATLKPELTEAHNNLGNLLFREGLLEDAVAAYRQAMATNPAFAAARTNILLILQYMAGISPEELFTEHRRFAEYCEAPLKPLWKPHANSREPHRRLRIGYVSADFRDHAVAYFIEPILRCHDREKFEVFCYYNHAVTDATTERLKALVEHWQPCLKLSDDALADQIRQDGIDILVDLSGHTLLNRLLTFARKPAPVQVTWLGYPGTTGLDAMDYRLTDARLDPPGLTERWHTETLLRLPASAVFKPAPESPEVNALPALASGRLTLACLNNQAKINQTMISVWARILDLLPAARLMLGNVNDTTTATRLAGMFAQAGVNAERLVLLPKMTLAEYLATHHQIDLALDTYPYGGGTTTSHSLWMGVPVVTLAGQTTASRQGAAMLAAAGLDTFVTTTEDEYVSRVVQLAQDLPGLNNIRQGLRSRLAAIPVTDAEELSRSLEQAFVCIWQKYCAACPCPPQSIRTN